MYVLASLLVILLDTTAVANCSFASLASAMRFQKEFGIWNLLLEREPKPSNGVGGVTMQATTTTTLLQPFFPLFVNLTSFQHDRH